MLENIRSFNLIYYITFLVIWLPSNEGLTSTGHAPVLSNLKETLKKKIVSIFIKVAKHNRIQKNSDKSKGPYPIRD